MTKTYYIPVVTLFYFDDKTTMFRGDNVKILLLLEKFMVSPAVSP